MRFRLCTVIFCRLFCEFCFVVFFFKQKTAYEMRISDWSSDVCSSDLLEGVVFETKSGPVVVEADVVVDCTGDGDIAALAGADFEIGRDDGLVQPMTLMFRMVGFDPHAFAGYVRKNPSQWRGVHGLRSEEQPSELQSIMRISYDV